MKKLMTIAVLILSVLLSAGCAKVYIVKVDSINDSSIQPMKYYQILPGNKDTSATDLQFKEFAGILVKAMSMQGYTLADAANPAELEVYLSYGVGEPEKHVYSYNEPVWGQTGADIYTQSYQRTNPEDNSVSQFSQTSIDPQYGITGYTSQTGEYTEYRKYVILDAYEIKGSKPGAKLNEIWKTSVSSSGKSKDLRKIFPGLLAAASPYIGVNTGGEVSVELKADSETLKTLKDR